MIYESDLPILTPLVNHDYVEIHSEEENIADKDEEFVPTLSSNETNPSLMMNHNDLVSDLDLPRDTL